MHKQAIVIGSGIVGIATAYTLMNKGYQVNVLERNSQPIGASIRNFGMIWPTGQPNGMEYDNAMQSRKIWLELSKKANFHIEENGSLHLAYQSDEQNVLFEFLDLNEKNRDVRWLSYNEVLDKSPGVIHDELIGAMYSAEDLLVDPREAIFKLTSWLQSQSGCNFYYNTPVLSIQDQTCISPGRVWNADKIFVCSGNEIDQLFPEIVRSKGILCQLQMMRTRTQPANFRLGPSLCGGLTLAHYGAFKGLPSLENLLNRLIVEHGELLQHGIHVMAAQNNSGEVIIGDSHEYGDNLNPFIQQDINDMILQYLNGFCRLPDPEIQSYWKGIYFKSTEEKPYIFHSASPYCTLINGFGGAGMTLAFGVIERELAHL